MTDHQREKFETAVVQRLKQSGFLEIEIRTEALVRCDDGYQDEVVNAGWHYWNAALVAAGKATPAPSSHVAVTEAAKRYLAAIDSAPENDIWDTWDGEPAEGAPKTASDASWAEQVAHDRPRLTPQAPEREICGVSRAHRC